MERWKRPHCRRGDSIAAAAANGHHPSFSSSLLDAIDRSIDKGGVGGGRRDVRVAEGGSLPWGGPARGARPHCAPRDHADGKKHDYRGGYSEHHAAACGRGVDGRWFTAAGPTEGKYGVGVTEKVALRRWGTAGYAPPLQHYSRTQPQQQRDRFCGNSTSTSSESSYGGFSSSEAESVALSAPPPLPKPVRTSAPPERKREDAPLEENKQKTKGSIRSRFRASKFYGELKKGRTPVSPGARLASFLNTLFSTAGNPKKAKISTAANPTTATGVGRGGDESACSTASSYSRSCLSKTPSSRGKTASGGGGTKRSVTFYPVSVIVDEDCRPCGQKCLYEDEPKYFRRGGLSVMEPQLAVIRVREDPPPSYRSPALEAEERKRAREAARDLISAYKEKKRGLDGFHVEEDDDEEEDEDEDDAASYSSSDLFELKNLAASGGGEVRYRDELPVYETTHLDTNRAIAQGLVV